MKKSIITAMLLSLVATPNMLYATMINELVVTYSKGELPSAYDGRSYCSTVKDQESNGTCWIYLSNSLLETSLMREFNVIDPTFYDFSEEDMDQSTSNIYTKSYGFERELGGSGCFAMALNYWTRGNLSGPVHEGNNQKSEYYVKQTANIETDEQENYIEQMKEMIYHHGAVTVSYYSSEYTKGEHFYTCYPYLCENKDLAYYYPEDTVANHGSIIVGWDDNYSKENFNAKCRPTSDGAFLVKNSWGTEWGNEGYFWLSYETPISDVSAIVEVSDAKFFDHIYEYDKHGVTGSMTADQSSDKNAYMNVYQTQSEKELLTALSTYAVIPNSRFKLYVSKDGNVAHLKEVKAKNAGVYDSGYLIEYEGYKTFELEESLEVGGKYLVAIEVTTPQKGDYSIPLEMNINEYCSNVSSSLNKGYIARSIAGLNTHNSYDIAQRNANICLKGFTKDLET